MLHPLLCGQFRSFVSQPGLEDRVPDATTVWLFRERLQQHGLVEELFEQFGAYLQGAGYAAKDGQIVDATLIPVPKQRNTREENPTIKQGEVPAEWLSKPNKLAQKDVAARWTKKSGMSYYGYKNHVNSDVGFKFIRRYTVTDASVHDSQVLGELLDADNPGDGLWADSAYLSVFLILDKQSHACAENTGVESLKSEDQADF
jgi:IS5 family transposase